MVGWTAGGVGQEKGSVAGFAELELAIIHRVNLHTDELRSHAALVYMSNMQYSLDRQYVSYMVKHLARKERLDD